MLLQLLRTSIANACARIRFLLATLLHTARLVLQALTPGRKTAPA